MTAQVPDRLMNKHPRVRLRGMHLYGVARGDIRANRGWGQRYEFVKPPQPPNDVPRCSALWRGYTAIFRLDSDGELELVSYRYPLSLTKAEIEPVNEKLSGDFWLVLKHNFFWPKNLCAIQGWENRGGRIRMGYRGGTASKDEPRLRAARVSWRTVQSPHSRTFRWTKDGVEAKLIEGELWLWLPSGQV